MILSEEAQAGLRRMYKRHKPHLEARQRAHENQRRIQERQARKPQGKAIVLSSLYAGWERYCG